MAEELEGKVTVLEERLAKATEAYKTLKSDYEKVVSENETLKKTDVKALENRIKELEDEITINGNSSEEIKALNERIEKAKVIFKEQKEKINEITIELEKSDAARKAEIETNERLISKLEQIKTILNN